MYVYGRSTITSSDPKLTYSDPKGTYIDPT